MPDTGERATDKPSGDEVLHLAQADPQRAVALTDRLGSSGASSIDDCIGWRARGIALRILDRNDEALAAFTAGRVAALALGEAALAASCDLSAAPVHALLGDVDGAFAALDAAAAIDDDRLRAQADFQRAGIALLIADWRRSREHYTNALAVLGQLDDPAWTAACLLGRGLMAAYVGDSASATADLDEARRLFADLDDRIGVGQVMWNQALASSLTGDAASAVSGFDAASRVLEAEDFPVDLFLGDQADALFSVGLHEEAAALALRCVAAYEAEAQGTEGSGERRNVLDAASRRLELSRILAATDQHDAAASHAELAWRDFLTHGQDLRAIFAELVMLDCRAHLGTDEDLADVADRAVALGHALRGQRQPEWRSSPLLLEAECALRSSDTERARAALARVARTERTLAHELSRIELAARLARDLGDDASVLRWVRRALRTVREAPRLTGSAWVEAALTRKLEAVADLGLATLLRRSDGARALALDLEFERAAEASRVRSARPTELLTEYRSLTRAVDEARNEGRDPTPIEQRRDDIARRIRSARTTVEAADIDDDHAALPEQLLRWFVAEGEVYLVRRRGPRTSVTPCGPLGPLNGLLDEAAFLLRRAFRSPSEARVASVHDAAVEIDRALGLLDADGAGPLVHLQPSAQFAALPFGLLPTLRDRPWVRLDRLSHQIDAATATSSISVVSGPDLAYASNEVERVAELYDDAVVHKLAPVDDAVAHLESSEMCHIAAHSELVPGNPMFSSIRFADGDMSLHDLETLTSVPRVAVLASCESARGERIGLKSLGISSALLAAGIDLVIGTALPIPDTPATVETMAALHRSLREGDALTAAHRIDRAPLEPLAELIADCLVPHVRAPIASGTRE